MLFIASCAGDIGQGQNLHVSINVDGQQKEVTAASGATVQEVLTAAGIEVDPLDRCDPPLQSTLQADTSITLIRVAEEFDVEQSEIPFEHQIVHNEALPEGEKRLVQTGVNGLVETTYRKVYEDGVEKSSNLIKTVVIQDAIPEIVMVGVQTPFTAIDIPGVIAYIVGGNAWIMEGSTANRKPVVTTGDLDGRIFSLSPDRNWLLFTRKPAQEDDEDINTLWAIRLDGKSQPVDLKVKDIVHFGEWLPSQESTFAYSTVEPRATAPGWQANNDLYQNRINQEGITLSPITLLDVNSGGIYGWWGTIFAWSPDSSLIAYARPDSIGVLDEEEGGLSELVGFSPVNTHGDWAWIPGLRWSPDGNYLVTVLHAPEAASSDTEESNRFDLVAIPVTGGPTIHLAQNSGMFTYPVPSPTDDKFNYDIAYLQAIFPEQSDTSRYRLVIMDRDGSNRKTIFPQEGLPGVTPQEISWSPAPGEEGQSFIALIYQENIWLVNTATSQAHQITGDTLSVKLVWK